MARNFEATDEGKNVMTQDGEMVGKITSVSGSTAHIKPDENLPQGTRRRLGWSEDDDMCELDHSDVESISDDGVHIKGD